MLNYFASTVFAGSIISLSIVWSMADFFNALMAIPNLLALLFLSKVLVSETNHYLWNDHLDEQMTDEELAELDSSSPIPPKKQ